MNADNLVKRGYRPWRPSPAAADLDVWHEYEVPTIGTFRSQNHRFLFALVGDVDPDRQVTVWAYTSIDEALADEVEFDSTAELNEWARSQFVNADVVYALARDFSIHRWGPARRVENIHAGAVTFIQQVLDVVGEQHNPALDFAVRQAAVGVLVDHVPPQASLV
jgi:hypothetical protein